MTGIKKYTARDIDVFVLTCNRWALLRETLSSILAQNTQGFGLTVLDNSTDGETQQNIASFTERGVRYYRTGSAAPLANFKAAQELSAREYSVIFHDDDLMHPGYIQAVVGALNSFKNLSFIAGCGSNFYNNRKRRFPKTLGKKALVFESARDFAAYLLARGSVNFPSSVYKTSFFKTADSMTGRFGKNHDMPFMIEAAAAGSGAVICDRYCVFSRQHPLQDSKNSATATPVQAVFNQGEYLRGRLDAQNPGSVYYKLYRVFAYNRYKDLYGYISDEEKKKYPWPEFVGLLKERELLDADAVFTGAYRRSLLRRVFTFPRRYAGRFRKEKFARNITATP